MRLRHHHNDVEVVMPAGQDAPFALSYAGTFHAQLGTVLCACRRDMRKLHFMVTVGNSEGNVAVQAVATARWGWASRAVAANGESIPLHLYTLYNFMRTGAKDQGTKDTVFCHTRKIISDARRWCCEAKQCWPPLAWRHFHDALAPYGGHRHAGAQHSI